MTEQGNWWHVAHQELPMFISWFWRALDYTINKEGLCLKEIALIKKKKIQLSHLRHTKSGRLLSGMRCPPFILFQALTVYRFQDKQLCVIRYRLKI